jgi:outer membrane protein
MSKKKEYFFGTLMAIAIASALFFGLKESSDKTAYIDVEKVYGDFILTKELSAKLELVSNKRQSILDSMSVHINQLQKLIREGQKDERIYRSYEQLAKEFQYKQQEFQRDNEALTQEYDQQVMKQLNLYVRQYGEEKGYTFIYGANGNGSLMFAKGNKDISDGVLEFINERYEGK